MQEPLTTTIETVINSNEMIMFTCLTHTELLNLKTMYTVLYNVFSNTKGVSKWGNKEPEKIA